MSPRRFGLYLTIAALVLGGWTANPASADPAERTWQDLTDDPSRAQLADYEILTFGPAADKAVRKAFVFPADAGDGLYGIDVSHHNGTVNWSAVAQHGVRFAYIKFTQGSQYRDPTYAANWAGAGAAGSVRRGAYHFLSAGVPGKDQAASYLALLKQAGGLGPDDLAPVLDVEWDFVTEAGKKVDRWTKLSAADTEREILDWVTTVEAATGRRPIIYTSASWWAPQLKGSLALQPYPLWIADYRSASIAAGAPVSVKQYRFNAWQFTDVGQLSGLQSKFDVDRVSGADLAVLMGKANTK